MLSLFCLNLLLPLWTYAPKWWVGVCCKLCTFFSAPNASTQNIVQSCMFFCGKHKYKKVVLVSTAKLFVFTEKKNCTSYHFFVFAFTAKKTITQRTNFFGTRIYSGKKKLQGCFSRWLRESLLLRAVQNRP